MTSAPLKQSGISTTGIRLFLIFVLMTGYSFSQSKYDSLYIQNIIQSEIELRYKKTKKKIPVFEQAFYSSNDFKPDSIFQDFLFGKKIPWEKFPIQSDYGFFVSNPSDSCLYIYSPVFNAAKDQFLIRFETRSSGGVYSIEKDYYYLKNKKWRLKKSVPVISF